MSAHSTCAISIAVRGWLWGFVSNARAANVWLGGGEVGSVSITLRVPAPPEVTGRGGSAKGLRLSSP